MNPLQGASLMNVAVSIPLFTAFLQGLLSFLSPCVLPLLPVYLGYLAGGGQATAADGTVTWPRKTVLVNSLFFALGISVTLILLGMAFSAVGQFLRAWQGVIQVVSGAVVVLFGLLQLGLIGKSSVFQREFRLPLRLEKLRMNGATAFLMGLCFSFSWTPCIGPTLSGILMTAAAVSTRGRGIILMAAYILGFILPFLAVGLFTGGVLSFFRKHRGMVKWTRVVSGALLIVMGILLMTGTMGAWSGWIASASAEEETKIAAPDFTLHDQRGETHTLSDCKGKVVLLNFWTTWCTWCIKEMPDLEALYHELGENEKDVVIWGMAAPGTHDTEDEAGVTAFFEEHGWTYPVLMDTTGEIFNIYVSQGFPTTWLIRRDGTVMGYVPGAMSRDQMQQVIDLTLAEGE